MLRLAKMKKECVPFLPPDYPKGRSVLVLQLDGAGQAIHVVWGIPKGFESPAALVTAYRPDPTRWDERFMERRK